VDQRPPAQADRQAQASGHGTIGWLLTGIGVAGVAVGSIFGLRAIDRNHASLEACRTKTLCSEEGVKLRDEAQAAATLSTVGFAVGGLSLAGGIAVLVAEPAEQAARFDTGSSVSGLVLESATVSVGGSF
jgi:serine/threonine-protein kinase